MTSDDAHAFCGALLARLTKDAAWIESGGGVCRIVDEGGAAHPADARKVAAALREGWLAPVRTHGNVTTLRLTGQGRKVAARAPIAAGGKMVLETKLVAVANGEPVYAEVNVAESPLSWLRSRAGGAYLTGEEHQAGERLREDFAMAQLTPRLTVDWDRPFGTSGGGNGVESISAAAMAARKRVARALSGVGPGLSDVLIAVCCFLHGLEECEKKLSWPRRSAKLVLKFALQRLAAHYRIGPADDGP